MADKTKISWTEATWNPLIGCEKVSDECTNCYAEEQAERIVLMQPGSAYDGVLRKSKAGKALPIWNGTVTLMPTRLDQPLRWQRARLIFVNSMSDLFHKDVPNEYIAEVFMVMAMATRHVFQVLTKRAERLPQFFAWLHSAEGLAAWSVLAAKWKGPEVPPRMFENVWLGVSTGHQAAANERIPSLLQCREFAAVLWVSAEPLLGPIDFWAIRDGSWYDREGATLYNALTGTAYYHDGSHGLGGGPTLDWIVVGGESGDKSRACDPAWITDIIEEARGLVPVYNKQLGAVVVDNAHTDIIGPDGSVHYTRPPAEAQRMIEEGGPNHGYSLRPHRLRLRHPKGGDMTEWAGELRVREWPRGYEGKVEAA